MLHIMLYLSKRSGSQALGQEKTRHSLSGSWRQVSEYGVVRGGGVTSGK